MLLRRNTEGGDQKGDTISMGSVGKKLYEAPRPETVYYPSPYATTRISMYSADSGSSSGQTNSLQRPQGGPVGARPEHTYDVPFPHKQLAGLTRYSIPSQDYQELFRESAITQLIESGEAERRHLIVQHMCLQQDSKNWSPTYIQRHPQQRLYRINMHSDSNTRYPVTQEFLSDGNSEDEESMREEKACLQAAESHELSEAECDRDYHQHITKGSQSPFMKFRMTKCGI